MKEHLISILATLQKFQDTLFVAYMCLGTLALKNIATARAIVRTKTLSYVAIGIGVFVIALYLMTLANYLLYPNYLDHVEATVACIAWLSMHGHALYPNWVTGDIYGLVYGPVLYFLHGLFLSIVPTITTSKVLGVASQLIAVGLIFIAIKQKVGNNFTSFLFIASLVMLFVPFGPFAYWTRAEPFLILISALALLAAIRLRPLVAGAIIGTLAGLAAGFKLHGFIYVAPTAIMTLARVTLTRDRIILAILGVACAILFVLLPFCLKETSLVGYSRYLSVAAHHSFTSDAFRANLLFALVLLVPAIVIWLWREPAINHTDFWLLVGLCISIAVAVVVGSVSGPYHLLPFAPLCLYAAITMGSEPAAEHKTEVNRTIAIIFLVLVLAYGPGGLILNSRLMTGYYRKSDTEREKIIELQKYLAAYPDAQIGISDDEHDSDTNYRILSVLQGHALHVDFVAWEDLAYVGVNEKNITRFIKGCEVPTWILPLGAPFTKLSWYTKRPTLSDDFRRIFLENYRLIQMGKRYQVWRCRSSVERTERN